MRIKYDEEIFHFSEIHMYSSFIWKNSYGEEFLCIKTGAREGVCIGKGVNWNFEPNNRVFPCEITSVSVKKR